MQPGSEATRRRSRRGFALLALVALAWAQLSLAVHEFDHPDVSAFDVCGVCLQLERCDLPLTAAISAVELDAARLVPELLPGVGQPAALPPDVRQRGPPPV